MIPPFAAIRTRLRVRQLDLLLALHEQGTLSGASTAVGMTQPAATKALRQLEQSLGAPLFVRHTRGVTPTEFGEAVIRYARTVFDELGDLREELTSIEAGKIGRVRLGVIMAATPTLLTQALAALGRDHPRLEISVLVETSDVLLQMLDRGQIDLMIGRRIGGLPVEDVDFERLGDEQLSVVARRDHPAAGREACELAALARFSWLLQPHPSPMRRVIDETFSVLGVEPPAHVVETSSTLTTLCLLQNSDTLAVLPTSVARFYADQGTIAVLPFAFGERLAPYGLAMSRRRRLTRAKSLVVEAIRAAARAQEAEEEP